MKRIKTKNLPRLIDRETETKLRLQKIERLAGQRQAVVPVVEFTYYDPDGEPEIDKKKIFERGVIFEAGCSDDQVRLLVRPDFPPGKVPAILLAMIAKILNHDGADWLLKLTEALDRAFAEMYDSMEEISFADIAKARTQPDEKP